MAFKKTTTASNTSNGQARERAAAFVNVSLPTRDGKSIRLFALPLTTESNDTHQQIFDYLTKDAKGKPLEEKALAERLETLKQRLILDIGFARAEEDRALDLG